MAKKELTQEHLKFILDYNPETGQFFRNGKELTSIDGDGYMYISINRCNYKAHRVAWVYVYGYWPKNLDHINRKKRDNRIINLREATHSENDFNKELCIRNNSGIRGVSWAKTKNKWRANICINRKQTHLGYFKTKEAAGIARKQAEKFHGIEKFTL